MFTDIVGYTSMMQKNEILTLELLQKHREIIRPLFSKYGGNEVKTIGDAFLVEYSNALEAVKCACEIQRAIHGFNLRSEPERRLLIRIGIHFGDIFYGDDGKDVYGNSVNIAARIEPLADPGGICITGQVYDIVGKHDELSFENLGEHDLKNVELPVSIFKVNLPWEESMREHNREFRVEAPDLRTSQFVGRATERARLKEYLAGLRSPHGPSKKLILISGEAGAGKTRLVNWMIGEGMQLGAYVARGYCQADIGIPYFPFSEAFSNFLSSHQGEPRAGSIDLASWLRISARTGTGHESGSGRDQMFEGTLRLLERMSRRNPLLLCLEDLHWSDPSTLALLHYLTRNSEGINILIVCTFRTEELATQLQADSHSLRDTLLLMSKEGLYQRIELGRMDGSEVKEIASSILGSDSGKELDTLVSESEGNPFYAIEYARLLKEETSKQPQMKTSGLTRIPVSIHDVIIRRLNRLQHDERRLIDCASLLGERFEPRIISGSLGLDLLWTIETLDGVARKTRILREELEGTDVSRFLFDHEKIREVVLGELSPIIKKEYHRRIAETLFKEDQEKRIEEIVFHYKEGKEKRKVLELAPIAAERALQRYAFAEAVVYCNWAIEDLELKSLDERSKALWVKALFERANAQSIQGLSQQALGDANTVLDESSDSSLRIRAIRICAESCFDLGRFTEALDYCKREELHDSQDPEVRMERLNIRATQAIIAGYRGEPQSALRELERVAQEIKLLGGKESYASILLSIKEFRQTLFDLENALKSCEEAKSIFSELGDMKSEMQASHGMAGIFSFRGDAPRADANYSRAAELGNKLGLYGSLVWIYLYWGLFDESIGQHEKAIIHAQRALDASRLSGSPYSSTAVWASLTRCYLRANRLDEAKYAFSQMVKLFESEGRDASLTLSSAVKRSMGFYHFALGENNLADSEYSSSIDLLKDATLGPYHEVETRVEYAASLLAQNREIEAKLQLTSALEIYIKLGNDFGVAKVKRMLNGT